MQQQLLSVAELGHALAERFEVSYVDIVPSNVKLQIARLLPEDYARSQLAGAIAITGRTMTLAMVAPDDIETIAEVELMTGYQIQPAVAVAEDIMALISRTKVTADMDMT